METLKPIELKTRISAELSFYCVVNSNQYDFGVLELECDGRRYVLDTVSRSVSNENKHTTISLGFEVDTEIYPMGPGSTECLYDLTDEDLFSDNLTARLYIGCEYDVEPDSVSLFVRHSNGHTKAIDINVD